VSLALQVSTHTSEDRLRDDIADLILDPHSAEDMSGTDLYDMEEEPVLSHQSVYK
jgi:hypothetical protein